MFLHVTVAWLRTLGRFARWVAGSAWVVGAWLRGRSATGSPSRERPPVGDVLLSLLVLLVLAAVVVLGLGML
jgi:hypothetical protein